MAGVLPPAAPLVIDDLAEALGLSAMPVREAVKRLVADGLVEELPAVPTASRLSRRPPR